MQHIIGRLPKRFQYTVHNMIAHPLSEVLYQLGLVKLSEVVHDRTCPPN